MFLNTCGWGTEYRIHEHDVADVFAAFDVDRDNVISERDMASFIHHDSVAPCRVRS